MKKILVLILTLALSSTLLLSACVPDEPQTSEGLGESSQTESSEASNESKFPESFDGSVIIDTDAIEAREYSYMMMDPQTKEFFEVYGYFSADDHRPEGYNQKIGSVLAIMMENSKNDNDKQFPVLIGALETETVKMEDIKTLAAVGENALIKITMDDFSSDIEYSAYYARMTATQIIALADNGIKCSYIGENSKGLPSGDWWETQEEIEAFCNYYGDMFVFDKDGEIEWSLGFVLED